MSDSNKSEDHNMAQRIVGWFADFFAWVKDTLVDEEARKATLTDLGLPADSPAKLDIPQGSLDSIDRYRKSKDPDETAFLAALDDIQKVVFAVKAFIKAAGVSDEAAIDEYSHRFFELMTLNYLRLHQPGLYWAGQPFGFIEEALTTHSTAKAYPERIVSFFKGIGDHFEALGWKLETEEQARALSDLIFIPLSLGLPRLSGWLTGKYISKDLAREIVSDILYGWEIVGDEPPLADQISDRALSFVVQNSPEPGGPIDDTITCTLMLVPRVHGGPGLLIALGGSGNVESTVDDWKFKFELISANAIDFLLPFDSSEITANVAADAGASFSFETGKDEAQQPFVVGISKSSRLEFGRLSFSGELSSTGAGVKLLAEDSALVINAAKDGDGFISETMPSKETRISFNFGIGLSSERGLFFEGGTGLRSIIPIAKSLGPINVQTLLLGLTPNTDAGASNLTLEAAAALDVKIGPVKASVDQIGFRLILDFAKKNPNLGAVDLGFGFKPPVGIGLAIDAKGVEGGGFLLFDPAKGQYAGILHININLERVSMTVKAVGLINTRLPDGTKGFSLIVIMSAEFMWPLGLGFTLTGLGLILGINRTFNENALQAGVKNHTLDSILFPKDPISNAPSLLAALGAVFPAAKGHHFIGGMVQITWGDSPLSPLLTINIGLAVEFGERSRLLVMGQLKSILPTEKNDLVRLQMDAIGLIDFDQKTASIDARLYDSRLAKSFTISGDMAMRLKWGDSPNFAMAVGGLHPAFNPPLNFPKLERLTINLSKGDNPRLRCEAYFALTSNTVQFGARSELYASAAGFSIQGEIGFDVLIQYDPFHFLADFHAQVQLKRGGTNLFKVKVEGSLSGPRPLHIKGKATFEILWWDVSIRINKTLVEGERPPLPEVVDVLPLLKEALSQPGNWIGQLPVRERPMVTLRAKPGAATDVLLHPLGTLTIKEGVVPLNFDISRFGQSAPAGHRRFTISSVSLGGHDQKINPVRDFFAPAQFIEMSDDEKLSRPSFETMEAGITFGSNDFDFIADTGDWIEVEAIKFETWILDQQTNVLRSGDQEDPENPLGPMLFYELSATLFLKQARFGAAGNSDVRRSGKAKYHTITSKHKVAKEGWSIVATDDLTLQPVPDIEADKPVSYAEAAQALSKLKQEHPARARNLKILRRSELFEE